MVNVETISYDKVAGTASNLFTINGVDGNTVNFASNQFTYNTRPAQTLTFTDLNSLFTNNNSFSLGIASNFPNIPNSTLIDTTFDLTRDANTITYLYQGPNAGRKIENLQWNISTQLCTVPLRDNAVTVTYAAFLFDNFMFARFLQEITA